MNPDTRQRIIDLIIQSYYTGGTKSLKVGKIAESASITRQALHRYHGDLLDYIKGVRDVAELLPKTEKQSVDQLLVESQCRVTELEKALAFQSANQEKLLNSTIDSYVTSLMQKDIALYETDEITIALEKQSTLIESYNNQLTDLKVQLARAKLDSNISSASPHNGRRLILDPNLLPALLSYKEDENYDSYLDFKDKEINKITTKVNAFKGKDTKLVIFLDRLISDFSNFIKSLPASSGDEIVVRLPLYTAIEVKAFISSLTIPGIKHIYIPECLSISDAAAQRKFRSINVPKQEIISASKAEQIHLFKGIDQVIHCAATPGK